MQNSKQRFIEEQLRLNGESSLENFYRFNKITPIRGGVTAQEDEGVRELLEDISCSEFIKLVGVKSAKKFLFPENITTTDILFDFEYFLPEDVDIDEDTSERNLNKVKKDILEKMASSTDNLSSVVDDSDQDVYEDFIKIVSGKYKGCLLAEVEVSAIRDSRKGYTLKDQKEALYICFRHGERDYLKDVFEATWYISGHVIGTNMNTLQKKARELVKKELEEWSKK